ncbi:hypothetical protein SLEP1_g15482 [Rubroshorea leprosula]|uniref:Reverse transcriptase domain-containing protein n=1 Tax=Rubroshorea leprosula TaxID=152421 RepID=A0AAV5ITF4_9ROSI|nr:hypothetical protein SLEP1_g15482 [Rubroshorea leprosula]
MINDNRGNWCLLGDFNATRNQFERAGNNSQTSIMRQFEEFIQEAGLVEIPLIGRKFTWYHPNGCSMSILDRFLLFEELIMMWPDIKPWGLKRSLSDHCPILLKNEKINWGPKPFKFFNVWLKQKSFMELIVSTWKAKEIIGWKGYQLKEKLKIMSAKAKEWSKKAMSQIDMKIQESKEAIANLDLKAKMMTLIEPFNEEEIRAVVWECGCDKSSGLDGFNFRFFEEFWQEIKEDVIGFAQEFQKNGKLNSGANASFITLIPKVNGSPSRQFGVSKGLKQGDPLSPFLFLIVAEGLNGIIKSAVDNGLFEGDDNWENWIREGRGKGSRWWQDVCRIDVVDQNRSRWISEGFQFAIGKDNKLNQMGCWEKGIWKWNLQWTRELYTWEQDKTKELDNILQNVSLT